MQTFSPELMSHMDARREQRELASRWRLARSARRGRLAARRSADTLDRCPPPATGAAAVLSA